MTALIGSGFDAMGWVPEGQRSGQMSYTTASKSAAYVTIGEEDAATYEAISAGRHFEDIQARMTFRLLQKLMLKEEMAILGGNASLQLGTPATPSLSASGSGGTLPAGTYSVIVVALTLEGYQNSGLATGVATTKTITGADGKTFVLNGGSSNKSANATQAVTSGQTLFATVAGAAGRGRLRLVCRHRRQRDACRRSRRSTAPPSPPRSWAASRRPARDHRRQFRQFELRL